MLKAPSKALAIRRCSSAKLVGGWEGMSLPTTGVLLEANDGDSKPDIGLVVIGGLSSLSCRSPAPKKLFGFRSDWTAVSVVEEKQVSDEPEVSDFNIVLLI